MPALLPHRHPLLNFGGVLLALALLFCSATVVAESDSEAVKPGTPAAGNAATDDKPLKCVHGCQRWGKFCNVDPRGVYKCVRRCEKFGEICE